MNDSLLLLSLIPQLSYTDTLCLGDNTQQSAIL